MSEKTILVTGATDGIGKATALALTQRGARVIVHGRSAAKVAQVKAEIAQTVSNAQIETAVADFAALAQVQALAQDLLTRFAKLEAVVHNAGVYLPTRQLSADGFELTLAVNHLAPFALTQALLPLLRASQARVITVASATHQGAHIEFADLQAEQHYSGYRAYAQSKLANVLFANLLAERERGTLTSNSLHPGVIGTKLLRAGFNMAGASAEQGAATSVYLATAPEAAHITGKYFVNEHEAPPAPLAHSRELQIRLWEVSERLIAQALTKGQTAETSLAKGLG